MSAEIFELPIAIEPADIDELGHVNNIVYLRWAQEIATTHWRTRASAAMVHDFVWVVTRHEADYLASLTLGDKARARTWVEAAAHGPLWARYVEIGAVGAAKPAAKIKSTWCLLDAAKRKPRRVPAEMAGLFFG